MLCHLWAFSLLSLFVISVGCCLDFDGITDVCCRRLESIFWCLFLFIWKNGSTANYLADPRLIDMGLVGHWCWHADTFISTCLTLKDRLMTIFVAGLLSHLTQNPHTVIKTVTFRLIHTSTIPAFITLTKQTHVKTMLCAPRRKSFFHVQLGV